VVVATGTGGEETWGDAGCGGRSLPALGHQRDEEAVEHVAREFIDAREREGGVDTADARAGEDL